MAGESAEIRLGNALPLANIPLGTTIHNIELTLGRGGQMVRSAGTPPSCSRRRASSASVRMPSGEVRRVDVRCRRRSARWATSSTRTSRRQGRKDRAGAASGPGPRLDHEPLRPSPRRWRGTSGAGGNPKTPWGKPALGYRTRHNKKHGRMIVRRRTKGQSESS